MRVPECCSVGFQKWSRNHFGEKNLPWRKFSSIQCQVDITEKPVCVTKKHQGWAQNGGCWDHEKYAYFSGVPNSNWQVLPVSHVSVIPISSFTYPRSKCLEMPTLRSQLLSQTTKQEAGVFGIELGLERSHCLRVAVDIGLWTRQGHFQRLPQVSAEILFLQHDSVLNCSVFSL